MRHVLLFRIIKLWCTWCFVRWLVSEILFGLHLCTCGLALNEKNLDYNVMSCMMMVQSILYLLHTLGYLYILQLDKSLVCKHLIQLLLNRLEKISSIWCTDVRNDQHLKKKKKIKGNDVLCGVFFLIGIYFINTDKQPIQVNTILYFMNTF